MGSLFGTARIRVRQHQYKNAVKLIKSKLSVITEPYLIRRSFDFIQAILPNGFIALHLRGGQGGGFQSRIQKVIDSSLLYFSKYGLLKGHSLYVATDIQDFKGTPYYRQLSVLFLKVYLLEDVKSYEASLQKWSEANPVDTDVVAPWDRKGRGLKDCKELFDPILEQMICGRATRFYGTPGSTFSALIHKAQLHKQS